MAYKYKKQIYEKYKRAKETLDYEHYNEDDGRLYASHQYSDVFHGLVDKDQVLVIDILTPTEGTVQDKPMLINNQAYGDYNMHTEDYDEKSLFDCDLKYRSEEKLHFLESVGLVEIGSQVRESYRLYRPKRHTSEPRDYRWPFSDKHNPYCHSAKQESKKKKSRKKHPEKHFESHYKQESKKKKLKKNDPEKYLDGQRAKSHNYGTSRYKRKSTKNCVTNAGLPRNSYVGECRHKRRSVRVSATSSIDYGSQVKSDITDKYVRRKASVAACLKMRKQFQNDDEEVLEDCRERNERDLSTQNGAAIENVKRHAAILARMKIRTQNEDNHVNDDLYKYAIQNHCLVNFYKSTKSARTPKRKRNYEEKKYEVDNKSDATYQLWTNKNPKNELSFTKIQLQKSTKSEDHPTKYQELNTFGLKEKSVKTQPIDKVTQRNVKKCLKSARVKVVQDVVDEWQRTKESTQSCKQIKTPVDVKQAAAATTTVQHFTTPRHQDLNAPLPDMLLTNLRDSNVFSKKNQEEMGINKQMHETNIASERINLHNQVVKPRDSVGFSLINNQNHCDTAHPRCQDLNDEIKIPKESVVTSSQVDQCSRDGLNMPYMAALYYTSYGNSKEWALSTNNNEGALPVLLPYDSQPCASNKLATGVIYNKNDGHAERELHRKRFQELIDYQELPVG
ncbi:uncharacterized protein LOC117118301 [Anneissia japonica]|uniref:uncharacterized protein LOC117118301 n=1 Tax=Anneissia japonica TaxID=1529436 RepID=UPI0014255F53|nr:uncharacterized protein LOC117118301 [Anneissia japonica]